MSRRVLRIEEILVACKKEQFSNSIESLTLVSTILIELLSTEPLTLLNLSKF